MPSSTSSTPATSIITFDVRTLQSTLEKQFRSLHDTQKNIVYAAKLVDSIDSTSSSKSKYRQDVQDMISLHRKDCEAFKKSLEEYFKIERREHVPVHFQFRKIYRML